MKQYRAIKGKWQFVPMVKIHGKPKPGLILVDGKPVSSRGGKFYLEWYEDGRRKTRLIGTSPREALHAWEHQSEILASEMEAPEEFEAEKTVVALLRTAVPLSPFAPGPREEVQMVT